jgi:2-polyprenyl-6-methoxyphenol hydroxylase-like FAD-dependent oxidoreductase
MTHLDVIVVGGGIGGLTAAYALTRQGLRVRVLEQADSFGEVGAGIQLAPNCTRILDAYGLLVRTGGPVRKRTSAAVTLRVFRRSAGMAAAGQEHGCVTVRSTSQSSIGQEQSLRRRRDQGLSPWRGPSAAGSRR